MLPAQTTIALSIQDFMNQIERSREEAIVLARQYHEGEQAGILTERLEQFLGTKVKFRMNVCRSVVSAVAERLIVTGFDSPDATLIDWVWEVWQKNKLDATQAEIHEGTLRDGEYFALVDWTDRPRIIPHQRYTDVSLGGDGFGCYMKYIEDDPNQDPEYGVKYWSEVMEEGNTFQRKTLYFSDRVAKFRRSLFGAEWEPYQALGDESWPLPWVDSDLRPIGIALRHFTNKGLRCEAWDAFPLQNAVNKSLVDLLASSDLTAFRIFYALGFIPTTDGKAPKDDRSNWMKLEPGQIVGTTKSSRDASFGAIEAANLQQLMDLTHQLVLWLAMVTSTPVSRFVSTKLIASDETLKEQEGPLISKVASLQTRLGNSWVECLKIARTLENTWGEQPLDPDAAFEPIWAEAAARGDQEKLDLLQKKQSIGIPREQLWKEAGYDQKTIAQMILWSEEAVKRAQEARQEATLDGEKPPADQNKDGGA